MHPADSGPLHIFEAPRPLVEASLRVLRLSNTAFDALFYDVAVLWTVSFWRGTTVIAHQHSATFATRAFQTLDLSASTNPEGSILVVDANSEKVVVAQYDDVHPFIDFLNSDSANVSAISITGVGSSALGSAAFAWNLSAALGRPVAAIVPGYGVADVVQQALGGFIGFGLTPWIKKITQDALAKLAPETATIGRSLMMTAAPGKVDTGAPVFTRGSGSSDVLHAILEGSDKIEMLFGHSKGALAIGNAIHDLPEETTRRLHVTTFGCPIQRDASGAQYQQFLGWFDSLGQLNSWFNRPDHWLYTHHSTNTTIPRSMRVSQLSATIENEPKATSASAPALLEDKTRLSALESFSIGRAAPV